MPNFVAICAKNGQRVELTVNRPTIDEARAELHHQGYSISDIREVDESVQTATNKTVFYFEILVEGKIKTGQIHSSDSLSAYRRLFEDLHYQVVSLSDNPNATPEEKKFFTNKILEMYGYSREKEKTKEDKGKKEIVDEETNEINIIARQVAKYYAVIERTVEKIEKLLASFSEELGPDRVLRLKELVSSLKQLKNIQNPEKLRILGEAALDRVGQLEIELIQKGYLKEKKETL